MSDDIELDELRRRKMAEMQHSAESQVAQAQRAQEMAAQKDLVLRAILEPEARERLTRIRMARPDVADQVENQLIALAQQGRVRGKVTDEVLKEFLARVTPKTREPKIERR